MKKLQLWVVLYVLVLLCDVGGIIADNPFLHLCCKPLLMPLLIVGLLINRKKINTTPWHFILIGLFFSWAGDLFLLFDTHNPLYFIGGLGSFLLAHIFYIFYYLKCGISVAAAFKYYKWWFMAIGAYTLGLVILLHATLGSLLLPVIAYAFVLSFMLITSIASISVMAASTASLFIIGASFFVLSDSALAINKFYQPFTFAGVIIMITYGIAQLLITIGTIRNNKILLAKQ